MIFAARFARSGDSNSLFPVRGQRPSSDMNESVAAHRVDGFRNNDLKTWAQFDRNRHSRYTRANASAATFTVDMDAVFATGAARL